MRLVALFLVLALACDSAPPSSLRSRGIGLNEDSVPLAFAIFVTNDGAAPARVHDVVPKVTSKSLISRPGDAGRVPPEFDAHVELVDDYGQAIAPNEAVTIKPGGSVELRCHYRWSLPPDAPPMLAVVRATFLVDAREGVDLGATVETKPLVFVLQSQPGTLAAVLGAPKKVQDRKLLAALSQIEGPRSDGFAALLKQLRQNAID